MRLKVEGLNKEFQRQIQILVEDHRKEVDVIIFCFKLILSDVEGFSTDKCSTVFDGVYSHVRQQSTVVSGIFYVLRIHHVPRVFDAEDR